MHIWIKKNDIKKLILFMTLTAGSIYGILVAFNSMNLAERIEIKLLPILVIAVAMWLIFPTKLPNVNNNVVKMFVIFCITELLFAILRVEGNAVYGGVVALIISFFMIRAISGKDIQEIYPVVCWSAVMAAFIVIVRFGIVSYNSQGVVYAFAGIMLLNLLCIKKTDKIGLFLLVVIGVIAVLSITKSRTSMMGFLFVVAISYIYLFMKKKTLKNVLLLLTVMGSLFFIYNSLESFFYKFFFQKWGNLDLTSYRTTIWRKIWANKSMVGNGIDYMNGGDAHNTLMQVLGVSGLVSALVFIILMLIIFMSIKRKKNKIIYVNFFVGWMLISCFENLDIFTSRILSVTLLFFLHLFLLIGEAENTSVCHKEELDE